MHLGLCAPENPGGKVTQKRTGDMGAGGGGDRPGLGGKRRTFHVQMSTLNTKDNQTKGHGDGRVDPAPNPVLWGIPKVSRSDHIPPSTCWRGKTVGKGCDPRVLLRSDDGWH